MDIYFLGTSSGTPTKSRNVTAIALLESQGRDWYLIDCGEATQHQLLRTPLSLNTLTSIYITHVHGDHCYGLPGVLASAAMAGRTKPLRVVAPEGIQAWCESTLKYTKLYLPFEVCFERPESLSTFSEGQFSVTPVRLSHRVPSYGYSFVETKIETRLNTEKLNQAQIPRGPLWGQLKSGQDIIYNGRAILSTEFTELTNKPRKVIVCGDNDDPELLADACRECSVLVHEATYTEGMAAKAVENGHSYAKQVAEFAEKNVVPCLMLTHFSPRFPATCLGGADDRYGEKGGSVRLSWSSVFSIRL